MIFACTCACRQPHTRQVTQTICLALIGSDSSVTLVVVAIRPHSVSSSSIARSSKIAHRPETGPESNGITTSGERDTGFDMSTFEAELVPGLEHARSVVDTMVLESIELNR